MATLPKRFQQSISKKRQEMVGGMKFIQENFPSGLRDIGRGIKQTFTKNVDFDRPDKAELRRRAETIKRGNAAAKKYLESHPGFKTPR